MTDITCFAVENAPGANAATEMTLVQTDDLESTLASLDDESRAWLARQQFQAKRGQVAWIKQADTPRVLIGWDGGDDLATLGSLPMQLAEGVYRLTSACSDQQLVGWGMGAYQFTRYKDAQRSPAQIVIPDDNEAERVTHITQAVYLCRDLINTPAQDMAPSHLAAEALALAEAHEAQCDIAEGDALLDLECGAIHAVGRAAEDPPRLVDITWGDAAAPKVTLVGKGVTFDSGGLDIKPASGMRTMKKDMGGAATALGLAQLIMARRLPVRLRVLIPTAENAIAGNAYRPGDVLHTHKGLTVEIDNTDAEGRLLLCDALSIACADEPEALFDFATLTGSARSAVGAEIAAMFCNDDQLANELTELGGQFDDPVWRMPLHEPYTYMIDSKVADVVNSAASPYAGSITAALFLQKFVDASAWAHFDLMAFNIRNRPARPEGGEALALRTVFHYLEARYGGD